MLDTFAYYGEHIKAYKGVRFIDDDGDGSVDEDCRISNAVIAQQNITVFMTQTARLMWTVYATNITSHQTLQLWKQQVKINLASPECAESMR